LLQAVEVRLQEIASDQAGALGVYAGHVIRAGGKRLRPLLVLLCSGVDDPACPQVIEIAAAAELIHTASLIHDDILDQADTRRGVPTLNILQGNHTAVLAGDLLFATAFGLLAHCHCPGALAVMTDAIRDMCQAEIEQKEALFQFSVTESMYLNRIEKKTASLLAACCSAGALAGGQVPEAVASLDAYGRNLGLCFQITDDLLDFTGDSSTLGKPSGSDLAQGILTLPVIYLLNNTAFEQGSEISFKRSVAPFPDQGQVQEIGGQTPHQVRSAGPGAASAASRITAQPEGMQRTGEHSTMWRGYSLDDQDYIKQAVCSTPALNLAYRKAVHFAREAAGCLDGVAPETRRTALLSLVDQVLQQYR
jgi:heptaprenyl diphosphate synthase